MDRSQALRTLRLDSSADGRMVESAYWHLVRQAKQRPPKDPDALSEIEALNDAYGTLAPELDQLKPRASQGRRSAPASGGSGIGVLDWFVDYVSAEALRTRTRWPRRNPEIALIGGSALVLTLLAIGAGASLTATFVAAAIICVAIWSPWRRSS